MSDSSVLAGADTIYVVQTGDSLSKIAIKFYGDANYVDDIAARNNIDPQAILFIGRKLVIPAARPADGTGQERALPASPGGTTSVRYGDDVIETVTTAASRLTSAARSAFWQDWRFWLAIGGAAAVLWFFSRRRN